MSILVHVTYISYLIFFSRTLFIFTNKTHTADLSNAGIVWIDNQSWDEHLTNSIYKKLNQDLIPGSIVIEYAMSKFGVFSNLLF